MTGRNTTGTLNYAENDRFKASRLGPEKADPKRLRWPSLSALHSDKGSTLGTGPKSRSMRLFDRVLLVVEVAGALVVAWLAWQYLYTVYFDTAPHRVSASLGVTSKVLATPLATVTRMSGVVPPLFSGSSVGGGEGVDMARRSPTIAPTATPTIEPDLLLPSRLRIPVMFLDSPVHEVMVNMGVWEVAPMDIGHHEGTANPGEIGNMVLAGHRDINSALFRELDRLKPGDPVFVSNGLREYRYVVKESFVVSPNHTEVMEPTSDKRVTLITCTPIGLATHRLIVTAILDE